MSELLSIKDVKSTRKERQCEWCGEVIKKGSKAIRHTGVFQGDFFSYSVHDECYDAMSECKYDLQEGFEPQSFERGCCCEKGFCDCVDKRGFRK